MRILFLTRKYPPSIGGMQSFSYNLVENFKKINSGTFLIANRKGGKNLPFFLPYSFIEALLLIKKNKIEILHLSDGLLAISGYFLKKLTGIKVAITIHGLDIIYPNSLYQKINPFFVKNLDLVICNSQATREECLKRGIRKDKCEVIPIGVNPREFVLKIPKNILKKKLSQQLGITFKNTKILLTVGRLVKRKGVVWFIEEVMPKLKKNFIYLISGEGSEEKNIKRATQEHHLNNEVFLLGKTDFETLKILYNSADIFIMPNIKVKGDMEGFGIVALEAAACGLPVVASDIEGIKDAVLEGKTGFLIQEKNAEEFIRKIRFGKVSPDMVVKEIKRRFSWKKIAYLYQEALK